MNFFIKGIIGIGKYVKIDIHPATITLILHRVAESLETIPWCFGHTVCVVGGRDGTLGGVPTYCRVCRHI